MGQLVPLAIGAVIILVVFRMVIGAVKSSAKLLLWLAIAAAAAMGWFWLQSQGAAVP